MLRVLVSRVGQMAFVMAGISILVPQAPIRRPASPAVTLRPTCSRPCATTSASTNRCGSSTCS